MIYLFCSGINVFSFIVTSDEMLTSYAAFFHDVFSYDPFPLDYFHEIEPMWNLPCFLHLNCEGFLDHPTHRIHPFLKIEQTRF